MSTTISEKRETVSFEVLKDKLPVSCYEAIMKSATEKYTNFPFTEELDESVYERYFNTKGPEPLSVEEQKELFENLGNKFIKNHFSTDTLRTFLDREPSQKRNRKDDL